MATTAYPSPPSVPNAYARAPYSEAKPYRLFAPVPLTPGPYQAPVEEVETEEAPPPPVSHTGRNVLIVIIVLLVLAVIAFLIYYFFLRSTGSSTSSSGTNATGILPVGSPCAINSDCASPLVCSASKCSTQAQGACTGTGQSTCQTAFECVNGTCQGTAGAACASDANCVAPLSCTGDICATKTCTTTADCRSGSACQGNVCVSGVTQPCASDAGCAVPLSCVSNACTVKTCTTTADCRAESVCESGTCGRGIGQVCTVNTDCVDPFVCTAGICAVGICATAADCPNPTTDACTAGMCVLQPTQPCGVQAQCGSPLVQQCDSVSGECKYIGPQLCSSNSDCLSGACLGVCFCSGSQGSPTCPLTLSNCVVGICVPCASDADCPAAHPTCTAGTCS